MIKEPEEESSEQLIRVLLAEDHKIVRQGLRALLDAQPALCVVGEAEDGQQVVAMAAALLPDVIVMDLGMPGLNGIEATRQVRELAPSTQILVLSMHDGEAYVRPAIRAGASGYLLKGAGLSDLTRAIRALARGEAFFSPAISRILLQEIHAPSVEAEPLHERLTPRESEILELIAEGHSGPQIAQLLEISPKTVEGHRGRIMKKLDVHSLAGLVKYALKSGLVDL